MRATSAPTTGIVFEPADGARYEDALRTLAVIKRTGLTNLSFCFGGIERHREFGKHPNYYPLRLMSLADTVPMQTFKRPDPSILRCNPGNATH